MSTPQPTPRRVMRLVDEVHGLSDDRSCVISVQMWHRDPSTEALVVTIRNGRVFHQRRVPYQAACADLAHARADLKANILTSDEVRTELRRLVLGWKPEACGRDDCHGDLDIGNHRCTECGITVLQVTSGRLSGVRRMPAITFPGARARS